MQSFYQAEVVSNESIGKGVRYLIIKPPQALSYEPGQFFILRLRDDKGELVERSYSAANYDQSGRIEFVIRIEPDGHMSGLIDYLETGFLLDIKGPFGRFGFGSIQQPIEKLVLIAGGVGISPLRSMIQKSFSSHDDYPLQLFYGFRNPEDFLFRKELEEYSTQERFDLIPSISQAGQQDWTGNVGYITDFLEGTIFPPESGAQCCICGPPPMVKSTREKLFELGFERSAVHVEAW